MALADAHLVDFPTFTDERGSLSVCEGCNLPFEVQRVYYLYDLGSGIRRGEHGHRRLQQVLICMHGAIRVLLHDGREQREFLLDDPRRGLYVPPMMWRHLVALRDHSVCAVLASEPYDKADYIADFSAFRAAALTERMPPNDFLS